MSKVSIIKAIQRNIPSVYVFCISCCQMHGISFIHYDDIIKWKYFSALLALCAGNSLVTCEFPSKRPVTRSFAVFFYPRLNKRLSKQSWLQWFETPSRQLWCRCNDVYPEKNLECNIIRDILNPMNKFPTLTLATWVQSDISMCNLANDHMWPQTTTHKPMQICHRYISQVLQYTCRNRDALVRSLITFDNDVVKLFPNLRDFETDLWWGSYYVKLLLYDLLGWLIQETSHTWRNYIGYNPMAHVSLRWRHVSFKEYQIIGD